MQDAYDDDKKNGNTVWRDSMRKEMINNGVTFEEVNDEFKCPPGYTKVFGRIIFDAKMVFTYKVRFVASGHRRPDFLKSTYP